MYKRQEIRCPRVGDGINFLVYFGVGGGDVGVGIGVDGGVMLVMVVSGGVGPGVDISRRCCWWWWCSSFFSRIALDVAAFALARSCFSCGEGASCITAAGVLQF